MSAPDSTSPVVGQKAPDINTIDQEGAPLQLKDFAGKYVVLYFYPKDNTPGCTIEAKEFQSRLTDFTAAGAVILGVSPDSAASHCKFVRRYGLEFPLAMDEESALAKAYGVWAEKSMFGRKYMGVVRSTFLIGPDGTLLADWTKVKADGHADEVLAYLQDLKK